MGYMSTRKIIPFIPSCHRPPNKFIKYYERPFDDSHGHTGTERMVVYLNKSGKVCEEQYLIRWDEGVY